MEDSRNIIKAIDALTLKAGGEVVDSKNITEAIDNLRAVYDQEAIGIDKTLTREGLAADAKSTGSAISAVLKPTILPNDADANSSIYNTEGFHVHVAPFSNDRVNFPSDFKGGLFIDVGTSEGMHWQFCSNYNASSVLYFRNFYQTWKEWKLLTNA